MTRSRDAVRRHGRSALPWTVALLAVLAVLLLDGHQTLVDYAECDLYAAPDGDDADRGSVDEPLRTAPALIMMLEPGQAGCLRAGTYRGDVVLREDDTTLRSVPGERAVLEVRTLEVADGAERVTVSDLDIVGGQGAVTVRPIGDDFVLARNDITNHNEGKTCVLVGGASIKTNGGIVKDNVIHHCGEIGSSRDHGVYAQNFGPAAHGLPGLVIEGNAFSEIGAYAIQLYPIGEAAVVRRNVIDGGGNSTRGGIVVDGPVALDDLIEDNIIANTQTGALIQRTGSGHVARGNCFWHNPVDIDGAHVLGVHNISSADSLEAPCPLGPAPR